MSDSRKYSARSATDRLTELIPGFGGYLARENRRAADAALRQRAADRLGACKAAWDAYMQKVVEQGKLEELTGLERVRSRLDHLQSSVRGEVQGYSGFFDRVQVDEQMLDQVYERDLGMLEGVGLLQDHLQQLAAAAATAPHEVAADVLGRIESLETHFRRRRELLEGLQP